MRLDWIDANISASKGWKAYELRADEVFSRCKQKFTHNYFDYLHPRELQKNTPLRFKGNYSVHCSYLSWGDRKKPLVICIGGIVNTSFRFCHLAEALATDFHVVAPDWVGRGFSGWLADERDYTNETCVEQIRQLVRHLKRRKIIFIGSSLGGSVAIDYCSRYPHEVHSLILNDVGPFIPARRRKRRAETLARFYVFRSPEELSRKVGASQKNDGPVSEEMRLLNSYSQTVWSENEMGRVYRHDIRALRTYQHEAQHSLEQWNAWGKVNCPVLLIHGMLSDALLPATIKRMKKKPFLEVMHVPDTGHTPSLSDSNQIWYIRSWLLHSLSGGSEWSVLNCGGGSS